MHLGYYGLPENLTLMIKVSMEIMGNSLAITTESISEIKRLFFIDF